MKRQNVLFPSIDGGNLFAKNQAPVLWITYLLFLIGTATMFDLAVEWPQYATLIGGTHETVAASQRMLVIWVLGAKSLLAFVPAALVVLVLLMISFQWAARVLLGLAWVALFSWMSADILLMTYLGDHLSSFLGYVADMVWAPEKNFGQWTGSTLFFEALILLLGIILWGIFSFLLARWISLRCCKRFPALCSKIGFIAVTLLFLTLSFSVIPASRCIQPVVSEKLFRAMPFPINIRIASQNYPVVLENLSSNSVDLNAHSICDNDGNSISVKGILRKKERMLIQVPKEIGPWKKMALVDGNGQKIKLHWRPSEVMSGAMLNLELLDDNYTRNVDRMLYEGSLSSINSVVEDAIHPKPIEDVGPEHLRHPPNVIIIIVESFRYSALNPHLMKDLDSWSYKGLRFDQHYSGSNCSELGLFTLLYGRVGFVYDSVLQAKIPAQMCTALRQYGYESSYITFCQIDGFARMGDFINSTNFDQLLIKDKIPEANPGSSKDTYEEYWPDGDRWTLAQVRRILDRDSPQFVVAFLNSSHYPYISPPEFWIHKPFGKDLQFFTDRFNAGILVNRYKNSIAFLHDELMKFIRSVDPERNVILITGDHGESFKDDGVFFHGTRPSEIQFRVPCVIVGPGIPPRSIKSVTSHVDLLPTLMHAITGRNTLLRNCHGRDLLNPDFQTSDVLLTPGNNRSHIVCVNDHERKLFLVEINDLRLQRITFGGYLDMDGIPISGTPSEQTHNNSSLDY